MDTDGTVDRQDPSDSDSPPKSNVTPLTQIDNQQIYLRVDTDGDGQADAGHGLIEGERVTYRTNASSPGLEIGNLDNGVDYFVHVVNGDFIQLYRAFTTTTLTFDRIDPPAPTQANPNPADPQDQIALQLAACIDHIWDQVPADGTVNLRFLFKKDGKPYVGKLSADTEFAFTAVGGENVNVNQALNPHPSGRWIFEGLAPGDYTLTFRGRGRFKGWKWAQRVRVAGGTAPLLEIELDR